MDYMRKFIINLTSLPSIDRLHILQVKKSDLAVVFLTTSIPNTAVTNIQIRLLCEDIQQLKAFSKIKQINKESPVSKITNSQIL